MCGVVCYSTIIGCVGKCRSQMDLRASDNILCRNSGPPLSCGVVGPVRARKARRVMRARSGMGEFPAGFRVLLSGEGEVYAGKFCAEAHFRYAFPGSAALSNCNEENRGFLPIMKKAECDWLWYERGHGELASMRDIAERKRAGFSVGGAHRLPGIAGESFVPISLDGYCFDGILSDYWDKGRTVMTDGTGGEAGNLWLGIWELLKSFLRYAIETLIAVGVFVVFLLAAAATRWVSRSLGNSVPELGWIFKVLELFLLVTGIVLLVLFIVRNSVRFAKELIRDIRDCLKKKP